MDTLLLEQDMMNRVDATSVGLSTALRSSRTNSDTNPDGLGVVILRTVGSGGDAKLVCAWGSHENIADLAIGAYNAPKNPLLLQPTTNLVHLLARMDISAPCEFFIINPRPLGQDLNNSVGVCRHGCARKTRPARVSRNRGSYASSTWFWFQRPDCWTLARGQ